MSSTEDKNSNLGLPGLESIRSFLEIMSKSIAEQTGYTPKWISDIETGRRDCSQKLQRQIASILCCSLADLNGRPTESRLREIKRAYHLKQAEEAGAARSQKIGRLQRKTIHPSSLSCQPKKRLLT